MSSPARSTACSKARGESPSITVGAAFFFFARQGGETSTRGSASAGASSPSGSAPPALAAVSVASNASATSRYFTFFEAISRSATAAASGMLASASPTSLRSALVSSMGTRSRAAGTDG